MASKPKRPPLDWEAIEREYRAGQLSLREIARQYKLTAPAIVKRAKIDGWKRNLAAAVRAETERRVVEVNAGVYAVNAREIVDAAVATNIAVVTGHRASLKRLIERIDRVFEMLEAEDKDGPGIEPNQLGGLLRDCSTALAKAIPLQRQAFNIGTGAIEDPSKSRQFDLGKLTDEQLDGLAEIAATASKPA